MGEVSRTPSEGAVLAAEMAEAGARIKRFYAEMLDRESDLTILDMLDHPHRFDAEALARVVAAPSEKLIWADLDRVAERDEGLAVQVWARAKREARDELVTGHRAARVMETVSGPWERAQFLAVRESFRDEWQPRGGIEDSLIDAMAQAYSQYEFWLKVLAERSAAPASNQKKQMRKHCTWETPAQVEAQAIEQAGVMAERFHRMYLRGARALRDHRRYLGPVVVRSAGQVNVGGQHVNVVG